MTIRSRVYNPLLGVMLLGFLGCSTAQPVGKLTGKVTLDGKPVLMGTVLARSDDGKSETRAEIGDEGQYFMDKVPAGPVKLAFVPPREAGMLPPGERPAGPKVPKDVKMPTPPKDVMLVKEAASFGKDRTLPGGRKIPEGVEMPEEMFKKMESRLKTARGIPSRYSNGDTSGLTFEVRAAQDNEYDLKLTTKK